MTENMRGTVTGAAEQIQEAVAFDNTYQYSETDKNRSRLNTGTVEDCWVEEFDNSIVYDKQFVVELNKDNDENVKLKFPFRSSKTLSGKGLDSSIRNILNIFGVSSDNVEDMIGRKCLYKEDGGLFLFNSRRSSMMPVYNDITGYSVLGWVGLILMSVLYPPLIFLSIFVGVIVLSLFFATPIVQEKLDNNESIYVHENQIH